MNVIGGGVLKSRSRVCIDNTMLLSAAEMNTADHVPCEAESLKVGREYT